MDIVKLAQNVQANCDIADAHFAQEFPLCIYLLKMRDYYRWTHELPLNSHLEKEQLGQWIVERENYWQTLEGNDFKSLQFSHGEKTPFDVQEINQILADHGVYYGAGFGIAGKPQFFLADIFYQQKEGAYDIVVLDKEHARNLFALPAMVQDSLIIIRRDAIKRYIAEKIEEWQWKRSDNAMARAMAYYDFENDFELALSQMCEHEINSIKLHELGEVMASDFLGGSWRDMLASISQEKNERIARAMKDHLADCLRTLPVLTENQDLPSIHFYMANFEGFRKQLWPALLTEYKKSVEANDYKYFNESVKKGLDYWCSVNEKLLTLYEQRNEKNDAINAFINSVKLVA